MVREPQGRESKSRLSGVLEPLLAGTAAIGVVIYVLLNNVYVRFYGGFGVRPEQVGFDRLAVIGRTGALAVIAIGVALLVAALVAVALDRNRSRDTPGAAANSESIGSSDESIGSSDHRQSSIERQFLAYWAVALALSLLVFVSRLYESQALANIEQVKDGQNVEPGAFSVVDIRVSRVEVAWLGEKAMPTELQSPYLMYLGQGADVAVFLSCGRTTVVVPADQVAVYILGPDEAGGAEFSKACGNP